MNTYVSVTQDLMRWCASRFAEKTLVKMITPHSAGCPVGAGTTQLAEEILVKMIPHT